MKPSPKKITLVVLLMLLAFGLDQGTKILAQQFLMGKGTIPVIEFGNLFVLRYALNSGAFLGLLGDIPDIFRYIILGIVPALALGYGTFYLIRYPHLLKTQVVVGALFLGGGWGNIFDRLFRPGGMVIDFLNFGFGNTWMRTGILNVADIFLFFGGILFILYPYIVKKHKPGKEVEGVESPQPEVSGQETAE